MTDIVTVILDWPVVRAVSAAIVVPPAGNGSGYDDAVLRARLDAAETDLAALANEIAALPAPYNDAALSGRVTALEGASIAWTDLTGKPPAYPAAPHTHSLGEVEGLTIALATKADAAAVLTLEAIQDAVAAMFQGGTHTNAAISYDDAAGTLSITGSGAGASLSQEDVEDFVGGLILQGTGINVSYDDAGNVLSIALSGESFTTAEKNKLAGIATGATANATDAQLRDRAGHTGAQPISTVTGLQAALDGKMDTTTFKTVNGAAITGAGDIVIPAGPAGTSITGVILTQAAYDALSTAAKNDASKLYLISG